MADKLLPCPHCGGNDITVQPFLGYWTVGCNDCFGAVMGKIRTKEEAINAWNTRPNPWHTGKPTEDGWYLCQTKGRKGSYLPSVLRWNGEIWTSKSKRPLVLMDVVAWQKITPYEGEK